MSEPLASPDRIALTIGLGKRPHHMALFDGTVKPRGIDLTCVYEFPEPSTVVRHKRIAKGELDGGEMSTSSFISSRAKGGSLIAIPVFPFRSFRHDSIFCHDKAGIKVPSDLIGKKTAVHRYNASTMTWARGILRDEYGIRPEDIIWYTAGEEVFEVAKPAGVKIEVIPPPLDREHGIEMVAHGALDAAIEPNDITQPGIARLFPNYVDVQREYYRRTRIYPIIHTVCLQGRIVQQRPWVAESLLEAFREAAALASRYIDDKSRGIYEQDKSIMGGEDPLAWGLRDGERRTLEGFMDYLIADGALAAKVDVDSLFAIK